jgi:hypothetical protein
MYRAAIPIVLSTLILISCADSGTRQLTKDLKEDNTLSSYFKKVQMVNTGLDESDDKLIDVLVTLDKSFDSLNKDDKFYTLYNATSTIYNRSYYSDTNLCDMDCDWNTVIFKTEKNEYSMEISPYKAHMNDMVIGKSETYKPEKEQKEYDAYNKKMAELSEKAEASKESRSSSENSSFDNKPSSVWLSKSYSEKYSLVHSELNRLQNQGYSIAVDESYFIEALNAFYDGNPDEPTSINEAILLVGLAGNAIN